MPSSKVMDKFAAGKLHSGGAGGPVVTDRNQAIAIKMSEQRKERAHGGRYPEGKRRRVSAERQNKLYDHPRSRKA